MSVKASREPEKDLSEDEKSILSFYDDIRKMRNETVSNIWGSTAPRLWIPKSENIHLHNIVVLGVGNSRDMRKNKEFSRRFPGVQLFTFPVWWVFADDDDFDVKVSWLENEREDYVSLITSYLFNICTVDVLKKEKDGRNIWIIGKKLFSKHSITSQESIENFLEMVREFKLTVKKMKSSPPEKHWSFIAGRCVSVSSSFGTTMIVRIKNRDFPLGLDIRVPPSYLLGSPDSGDFRDFGDSVLVGETLLVSTYIANIKDKNFVFSVGVKTLSSRLWGDIDDHDLDDGDTFYG